jgi:hypothetical protein
MIPATRTIWTITPDNHLRSAEAVPALLPDHLPRISVFVGDEVGLATVKGYTPGMAEIEFHKACMVVAAQIMVEKRPVGCTEDARVEIIYPSRDDDRRGRTAPSPTPLLEDA